MSSAVDMLMEPGFRFPRLFVVPGFRFASVHVQLIKFTVGQSCCSSLKLAKSELRVMFSGLWGYSASLQCTIMKT